MYRICRDHVRCVVQLRSLEELASVDEAMPCLLRTACGNPWPDSPATLQ
jgi:hypothetical protein